MNDQPFSFLALTALIEAVTHLASSDGTLTNRLTEAATYLDRIRPADVDAELWAEIVKARATIKRGGSPIRLQRAAETLVKILVRYSYQRPQK